MKVKLVNKKRIIRILVAVAAAAAIVLIISNLFRNAEQDKRPVVRNVNIASVYPVEVNDLYETSGTIKAKIVSKLASRVMGTVTAVNVREGQMVNQGQELLTIDSKEFFERLRAAQAAAEEAEKALNVAKANKVLADTTFNRYRRLYESKAVSGQEMDQVTNQNDVAIAEYSRAESAAARAIANVEEARINTAYLKILSPMAGVVTQKKIDIGSMAAPGMTLMVVEDISAFEMDAYVDEQLANKITPHESVDITIDSVGAKLKGEIAEVVPAVDPMSRTYLVKINIPTDANAQKSLKTGLYAKVLIPQGQRKALLVPSKAVVENGQLLGVYAVDPNGIISYRLIRIGKSYGDNIVVLSGIDDGQRIIVSGVENAIDGGVLEKQLSKD